MISFARTILLVGLAPTVLGAQSASVRVEPGIGGRVAGRIAEQWCVAPETVCLEWGHGVEAIPPGEEVGFRIVGSGSDGSFAVVFDRAAGKAVSVRVRAGVRDTVMVAARPLDAGCLIDEGHLRPEVRLEWGVPKVERVGTPGPGWEVRRRLDSGEAALWPAVVPPSIVLAGEPVRLEWTRGAVTISVTGLALNSARRGETVQARVAGRRGRLNGVATEAGKAALATGGVR